MKVRLLIILCVGLPAIALAKKGMPIERGGLGFVYPDANNFSNAGQIAMHHGTRVEAAYSRQRYSDSAPLGEVSGDTHTATTSAAFGNGIFGIGGFASRFSAGKLDSNLDSTDVVGGAIGVGLAKQKVSVGAGYVRSIDGEQGDDGVVSTTITLNASKFRFGVGGSSTLRPDDRGRQTATVGLGVALGQFVRAEAVAKMADFGNGKDSIGSFFLTATGSRVYAGAGYSWFHLDNRHNAQARLGVIIAKVFDISASASHTFYVGSNPAYGGSARIAF